MIYFSPRVRRNVNLYTVIMDIGYELGMQIIGHKSYLIRSGGDMRSGYTCGPGVGDKRRKFCCGFDPWRSLYQVEVTYRTTTWSCSRVTAISPHAHWGTVIPGLYSLSGRTSYRKISWSFKAERFGFTLFQSLWKLTGISAVVLPRCLWSFREMISLKHPISRLHETSQDLAVRRLTA